MQIPDLNVITAQTLPYSLCAGSQSYPPGSPGASVFSDVSAVKALCILANFSAPQVHSLHPVQTNRMLFDSHQENHVHNISSTTPRI